MATESSPFVRASTQRSSLRDNQPPPNLSVQAARHRALQAAEYYHQQVLGGSSPDDSFSPPPPSTASQAVDSTDLSNDIEANRATPTSDAYYKHKLRTGFIDLRNSYNEKRPRKMTTQYRTGMGTLSFQPSRPGGLQRVKENTPPHVGDRGGGQRTSPPKYGHRPTLAERRGLYRSNSSLELEKIDYIDSDHTAQHLSPTQNTGGALRRDYGSANSLDLMGSSGDSFFAMLQDYRNENVDQRAPPPPQVHELLRGQPPLPVDSVDNHRPPYSHQQPQAQQPMGQQRGGGTSHNLKISNGALLVKEEDSPPNGGAAVPLTGSSPRLKPKSLKNKREKKERAKSVVSEASSGILKKLRGTKSDPNHVLPNSDAAASIGEPVSVEERQRRKAFVHYDCQSIGVNLADVIKRRSAAGEGGLAHKNVTTGASAASGVKNVAHGEGDDQGSGDGDSDQGDGKSNDLVLSCPFFRNEVGSEEERTLCLNRSTAQKRVQQLLGNRQFDSSMSQMRRPVCNGLAVLDSSSSPHGVTESSIIAHRGLVVEYVDQGALYYRQFFQGFGE